MKNDLTILLEFLERTGPEVTGRQTVEPEVHVAELLERFARGECDADERADVCQMLRLNPPWMHWLASRVVQARGSMPDESHAAAG
jgi:hypothetical protein